MVRGYLWGKNFSYFHLHRREELRLMGRNNKEADLASCKKVPHDTSPQGSACSLFRMDRQGAIVVCWNWAESISIFFKEV